MMDVELKNDGPVGLDYRSEDEAVQLDFDVHALNGADGVCTGHYRGQYEATQEGKET